VNGCRKSAPIMWKCSFITFGKVWVKSVQPGNVRIRSGCGKSVHLSKREVS